MRVEETKVKPMVASTHDPYVIQPTIKEASHRIGALKEIVNNMRNNLIPKDAPRLTREDLHARR